MTTSTHDQILKMIKRLNLPEQVHLLATLSCMVRDQVVEAKSHSIMELEGLGAEIWRDSDAQTFVDHERASWES